MTLLGTKWKPRDVARLLWDEGWVNAENLMIMVAILGAEAEYYEHAWHYNESDGSTDWGIFELNDGNKGGVPPDPSGNPLPGGSKSVQEIIQFRAVAWDAKRAVVIARQLYENRHFTPWAAYNSGRYETYIPQACVAVCNMLAVMQGLNPVV